MIDEINLIVLININIILLFCLLYDLKYRIIPNWPYAYLLILGLIVSCIQFIYSEKNPFQALFIKIIALFLAFFISFILFILKIIGGADGKLIILIFLSYPLININFSKVFLFFILFLGFFFFTVFFSLLFTEKILYNILFNILNISSKKQKLYLRTFFRFYDISKLEHISEYKVNIQFGYSFYNSRKERLQFLAQYRPPLIAIIYVVFNSWYLILTFSNIINL